MSELPFAKGSLCSKIGRADLKDPTQNDAVQGLLRTKQWHDFFCALPNGLPTTRGRLHGDHLMDGNDLETVSDTASNSIIQVMSAAHGKPQNAEVAIPTPAVGEILADPMAGPAWRMMMSDYQASLRLAKAALAKNPNATTTTDGGTTVSSAEVLALIDQNRPEHLRRRGRRAPVARGEPARGAGAGAGRSRRQPAAAARAGGRQPAVDRVLPADPARLQCEPRRRRQPQRAGGDPPRQRRGHRRREEEQGAGRLRRRRHRARVRSLPARGSLPPGLNPHPADRRLPRRSRRRDAERAVLVALPAPHPQRAGDVRRAGRQGQPVEGAARAAHLRGRVHRPAVDGPADRPARRDREHAAWGAGHPEFISNHVSRRAYRNTLQAQLRPIRERLEASAPSWGRGAQAKAASAVQKAQ